MTFKWHFLGVILYHISEPVVFDMGQYHSLTLQLEWLIWQKYNTSGFIRTGYFLSHVNPWSVWKCIVLLNSLTQVKKCSQRCSVQGAVCGKMPCSRVHQWCPWIQTHKLLFTGVTPHNTRPPATPQYVSQYLVFLRVHRLVQTKRTCNGMFSIFKNTFMTGLFMIMQLFTAWA